MLIDMKYFNVYYFCHLANESMGNFEYARINAEFTERMYEVVPKDFPRVSVLREYCYWLIDRVFYEQANYIANSGDIAYFNPISWINQAIKKYRGIEISDSNGVKVNEEDFLENMIYT